VIVGLTNLPFGIPHNKINILKNVRINILPKQTEKIYHRGTKTQSKKEKNLCESLVTPCLCDEKYNLGRPNRS